MLLCAHPHCGIFGGEVVLSKPEFDTVYERRKLRVNVDKSIVMGCSRTEMQAESVSVLIESSW